MPQLKTLNAARYTEDPSARTRTQHTQIKTNNKYQKINEGYHISPLLHSIVVFNQGTDNQDALLKENKKVRN